MYKMSSDILSLYDACAPQAVFMIVEGVEGLTHITGADILRGSFALERSCFPDGSSFIGEAAAAEMVFTLSNRRGKFTGIRLEGARLTVSVGVRESVNVPFHLLPMGVFTVDEAPRSGYDIHVSALDNLALTDRPYVPSVSFPATHRQIAADACAQCGLTLSKEAFLGDGETAQAVPQGEGITCRQVLRWIAACAGGNAYADWFGAIRIGWLTHTDIRVTPANRYDSELSDEALTVTGVRFSAIDGTVEAEGSSGYVIGVRENQLIQYVPFSLATSIAAQVVGFTYRPFSAECRPMPYLWPMDTVTFAERDGTEHRVTVSAITYTLNGRTTLRCEGAGGTVFDKLYTDTASFAVNASGTTAVSDEPTATEQEEKNHA